MKWHRYSQLLTEVLDRLTVTDRHENRIDTEAGFEMLCRITHQVRDTGSRIFFIGNGASASMASHFSTDIFKSGGVKSEVFTDLSLITAFANDTAYEKVFSEPLRLKMIAGDALVAISSSGNSPNIAAGCAAARQAEGTVVTLSAMSADNRIRSMGDLNFYVPAETYGVAETTHAAILHYWMDIFREGR